MLNIDRRGTNISLLNLYYAILTSFPFFFSIYPTTSPLLLSFTHLLSFNTQLGNHRRRNLGYLIKPARISRNRQRKTLSSCWRTQSSICDVALTSKQSYISNAVTSLAFPITRTCQLKCPTGTAWIARVRNNRSLTCISNLNLTLSTHGCSNDNVISQILASACIGPPISSRLAITAIYTHLGVSIDRHAIWEGGSIQGLA